MIVDALDVAVLVALLVVGVLAWIRLRRLRVRRDIRLRRLKATPLLFVAFFCLTEVVVGVLAPQIARDEHPRSVIVGASPLLLIGCAIAAGLVALRPEFPSTGRA